MTKTIGVKEVTESVLFDPQATCPTAVEGKVIYECVSKVPMYYDGTQWVSMSGGGSSNYCVYNPDYAVALCEDFTTASPYVLTNSTDRDFTTRVINCYFPVTTEWVTTVSYLASVCCCKIITSPLFCGLMTQCGSFSAGAGSYIWMCNNLNETYACTCNICTSVVHYYNGSFSRIYNLCSQDATSNFLLTSCVAINFCSNQVSTCAHCICHCLKYSINFKSTDATSCEICLFYVNLNCVYANPNNCCNFICSANCNFSICVCSTNCCIYTTVGNVAFDFGAHGFLCEFTICRFNYYCQRGLSRNTCSKIIECCLCYTGVKLTNYCVDFLYKTSCQNITLPLTYKMFAPALIGPMKAPGITPYFNYCIVGLSNFTSQKNFQKQCSNTAYNCVCNLFSQYCVNVVTPNNCFCYTTCTDCLNCCFCLTAPCYNLTPDVATFCNRFFTWRCVE